MHKFYQDILQYIKESIEWWSQQKPFNLKITTKYGIPFIGREEKE